jgi:CDGSH-type Zn-finger protein/truncated hemoglobin YjbI
MSQEPGAHDISEELLGLLALAGDLEQELAAPVVNGQRGQQDLDSVLRRLQRSVIRPLGDALAIAASSHSATSRGHRASRPESAHESDREASRSPAERAWELAKLATRLRCQPGVPSQLVEATAALHELTSTLAPTEAEERIAELKAIQEGLGASIQPQANGPYLITNAERLRNWLGEELPTMPQMALCRCGQSALKPFCDGTHAEVGFTDEKDPERVADRRDEYLGLQVTVLDNRGICQHSGFCTDRLATVFHSGEEPFVSPSGGRMDEIIRAVRDCPSGALSYAIDGVEARDEVDYHGQREPTIEVSKDGPYRVTGGIPLTDGAGKDEPRNDGASREHYALCRCGHSQNKPFCSGMHWYVDFKDPAPDEDHEPTVFEWAGGLPALTRMTRIFYEKYIPEDPLLAPVFANMASDHPQRVAKWLGEVFGGPKAYSEKYGGYTRMISQHLGKALTEEKRTRWVELISRAAQDAGLPNDAEFQAVFHSYIEWGSRLAVENSQVGAKPPEHMPMPHWDWTTNAGPPGSRVSAIAPEVEEEDAPVVLPGPDEAVSFDKHVKTLFRRRDRDSMKFVFDLWSYGDVSEHADAIVARLEAGSMPCDGAWPEQKIEVFRRWIEAGQPK